MRQLPGEATGTLRAQPARTLHAQQLKLRAQLVEPAITADHLLRDPVRPSGKPASARCPFDERDV